MTQAPAAPSNGVVIALSTTHISADQQIVAGTLWDFVGPAATFAAGAIFATIALACVPVTWRMRDGK